MHKCVNEGKVLGNVTSGPFKHETKNGKLVARFVVSTESEHGGEIYTQNHNITAWMDDAQWVLDKIEVGQTVFVSGEMRTRSYPGNDGTKHYSFEVVATPVKFGGIIVVA